MILLYILILLIDYWLYCYIIIAVVDIRIGAVVVMRSTIFELFIEAHYSRGRRECQCDRFSCQLIKIICIM